jgi:SP family xylose:H+ symportor-like MFS transporter
MENYNKGYILRISLISAMGGYLFGFDFAVITGGLPFLSDQFNLDASGQGATTASLAIGCIAGCLVAGGLSDRYGRKPGLLTAASVFTISSLFMGLAPSLYSFIVARFFAGVGVGMASMLSPVYIAEVSPAQTRGRMVSLNQLTIVLGIVITHLVNFGLKDIGPEAWRWMFGSGMVPALMFLFCALFLPESPRWLVKDRQEAKALAVLKKIGNQQFAAETLSEIKSTLLNEENASIREIFSKDSRAILLIGIVLAVFQQWCGINIVFNYTPRLFESIGADRSEQLLQAVYIGLVNLACTLVAMALVDRIGRKPLMLIGAGGLAVTYIILAIVLKNSNGWILSPILLAAIGLYGLSLAPVTWVLISEIFPNRIRGRATSIAVISLWAAYSILVYTYPVIAEKTGEYLPFFGYSVICIIGFLFILFRLPETKGKSLEKLESMLSGRKKDKP